MIEGNVVESSAVGFHIGDMRDTVVTGNTATGNRGDGFNISELFSGELSANTAQQNGGNGFYFNDVWGGIATGNVAMENQFGGFKIEDLQPANTHTFSMNSAIGNTLQGYFLNMPPESGSGTNTGSGNGSDDEY